MVKRSVTPGSFVTRAASRLRRGPSPSPDSDPRNAAKNRKEQQSAFLGTIADDVDEQREPAQTRAREQRAGEERRDEIDDDIGRAGSPHWDGQSVSTIGVKGVESQSCLSATSYGDGTISQFKAGSMPTGGSQAPSSRAYEVVVGEDEAEATAQKNPTSLLKSDDAGPSGDRKTMEGKVAGPFVKQKKSTPRANGYRKGKTASTEYG